MPDSAKLSFKVQDKSDKEKWRTPKWKEVEVENATCPKCGQQMTVIIGDMLYAHCARCQKYFVGS
jgi:ssDNA-binding Zn-finger/Zn-ribbon topoisomerase 1